MGPVDPEKVNMPVEVGLQFLGNILVKHHGKRLSYKQRAFPSPCASTPMRFRHRVGDVGHMCVAAESPLPDLHIAHAFIYPTSPKQCARKLD